MRKYLLAFLFLFFLMPAYGQFVKGTIFDARTNEVIPYANIYYDQSFTGTMSDHKGNFKIKISKDRTIPLVVSAVGYYSATFSEYSNKEHVYVHLEPKVYEIRDVVVSTSSLVRKRKRYLRLFRQEFIGTEVPGYIIQLLYLSALGAVCYLFFSAQMRAYYRWIRGEESDEAWTSVRRLKVARKMAESEQIITTVMEGVFILLALAIFAFMLIPHLWGF